MEKVGGVASACEEGRVWGEAAATFFKSLAELNPCFPESELIISDRAPSPPHTNSTMEKMIKNPEVLTVCSDDELLKSLIEVCMGMW